MNTVSRACHTMAHKLNTSEKNISLTSQMCTVAAFHMHLQVVYYIFYKIRTTLFNRVVREGLLQVNERDAKQIPIKVNTHQH